MSIEANSKAATSTKAQLAAAGLLDAAQAGNHAAAHCKALQGFSRKVLPPGLPDQPKFWIYSVSEYGDFINLGAGFKEVWEVKPCPEGKRHGPACPIKPLSFFEEVKVDVTEQTPYTDIQIAECLMRTGAGMTADQSRTRIGWFLSENNPPKADEIDAAVKIYIGECLKLVRQANLFAEKRELNEINDTHRRAATYLKQKVDWDKPQHQMIDCPRCGEPVKAGAVVHATPYCGHVFELLPYWKSMIESGQKTMADAPESIQADLVKELKKAKKD